jgi:hypothetical protein
VRQKVRQKIASDRPEPLKPGLLGGRVPLIFGRNTEGQITKTPVFTGVLKRAREDSNL